MVSRGLVDLILDWSSVSIADDELRIASQDPCPDDSIQARAIGAFELRLALFLALSLILILARAPQIKTEGIGRPAFENDISGRRGGALGGPLVVVITFATLGLDRPNL